MDNQYRELTARELQAIRKLVTSECANFNYESGRVSGIPCYCASPYSRQEGSRSRFFMLIDVDGQKRWTNFLYYWTINN